jgi:hypothetical protein
MSLAIFAAAGILAAGRAYQLKKDADQIQMQVSGAIHSIKADGVRVRLTVRLKNPTKSDFKFTFPFVKLISSSGRTIGSSQADNSEEELKAGEEKTLKTIMLTFPFREILALGLEFFKSLREGKQGFKIQVVASTYALLLLGTIKHKVEWRDDIILLKTKTDENE